MSDHILQGWRPASVQDRTATLRKSTNRVAEAEVRLNDFGAVHLPSDARNIEVNRDEGRFRVTRLARDSLWVTEGNVAPFGSSSPLTLYYCDSLAVGIAKRVALTNAHGKLAPSGLPRRASGKP